MNQILLLEDLPEIRSWLKTLVLQVFPNARMTECSRVQDALIAILGEVRLDQMTQSGLYRRDIY